MARADNQAFEKLRKAAKQSLVRIQKVMTAQIDDNFIWKDQSYSVSGISEGSLFDISLLDLNPQGSCTACYRGYQAEFGVVDSKLALRNLHCNLYQEGDGYVREIGPAINGIPPKGPDEEKEYDWFNNHYEGIDYYLEYSGGILAADGFIDELYVHMGFHPAWKYKTVFEFVFENGILQSKNDRSEKVAEIRDFVAQQRQEHSGRKPDDEELRTFIVGSFDRSYET